MQPDLLKNQIKSEIIYHFDILQMTTFNHVPVINLSLLSQVLSFCAVIIQNYAERSMLF